MGTETGPTLKIITTYREMTKWISNIKTAFLKIKYLSMVGRTGRSFRG
jgi:hypothetical protein